MTEAELKAALTAILAEERRPEIDWQRVHTLASDVIRRLNTEPEPPHPIEVYQFLDDVDIRQKDARRGHTAYAARQRSAVETFLGS